jgi:hypothetical protein
MGAVTGAMGEHYGKEVGRRVRAALRAWHELRKAQAAARTAICPRRSLALVRLKSIRSKRPWFDEYWNYSPRVQPSRYCWQVGRRSSARRWLWT